MGTGILKYNPLSSRSNIRIALIALIFLVILLNAWVTEDAYITFRSISNLLNGFGPRWNSFERVQAYTHPLWFLLLSLAASICSNLYFLSLVISLLLSGLTVLVVAFRLSGSVAATNFALLCLLFSKCFVDYSTSGLENPLSHLLLVTSIYVFLRRESSNSKLLILSILGSLCLLNRLDNALFIAPMLFSEILTNRNLKTLLIAASGFIPLLAWEIFSFLYYGALVPNSAYAKLGTGFNNLAAAQQGLYYLLDSFLRDPTSFSFILLSFVCEFARFNKKRMCVVAGILLYLVYIIYIGGDYMSGRFIASMLVCSVALFASYSHFPLKVGSKLASICLVVLAFCGLGSKPSIYTGLIEQSDSGAPVFFHGISDERTYYSSTNSLKSVLAGKAAQNPFLVDAEDLRNNSPITVVRKYVGMLGFYAGPGVKIIDELAIGDPLLSRLPSRNFDRIGHFSRELPEGYFETVDTGNNVIKDPDLHEYYEVLSIITQGDLFSFERLKIIVEFNLGLFERNRQNYLSKLRANG